MKQEPYKREADVPLSKRILLILIVLFLPIYGFIALSICWVLIFPFGKSDLLDEINKSFVDIIRDVPRAWKIIITGKDH